MKISIVDVKRAFVNTTSFCHQMGCQIYLAVHVEISVEVANCLVI